MAQNQSSYQEDGLNKGEVDLALLDLNLRLTVEERIRKHDEAARLVEELSRAGKMWRDAKPW